MTWDHRSYCRKLAGATHNRDRRELDLRVSEIRDHLYHAEETYPEAEAIEILECLKHGRYFEELRQIADVFLQSGQRSATVRKLYGQALLDQGNLTAAIETLKQLAKDTRKRDPVEYAEARGLLGRAFKQIFVNSGRADIKWVRKALRKSIDSYYEPYAADPERNLWHGINCVAVLSRAEKEGVKLSGYPEPDKIARALLNEVNNREQKNNLDLWDCATAAEACIVLEDYGAALQWVERCTQFPDVDAFTLGSFERQLREVWGMTPESEPGSFFLPVVRKELLKQEGGAVEITADDMHVSKAQKKGDEKQLEKILGNTGVQSYRWWMRGVARAQSVARIGRDVDRGEGTGFLVKGCDLQGSFGDDVVLLTNAHVVSETVRNAIRPDEAVILFESHDGQEPIEYSVTELLWSSPPDELDTSILRLDKPVKGIEPCPVHSRLPSPNRSRVYIIGHPQGGTLSFSVQDNKLLDHEAPIVHYHAPTEPGSSGSPVFNAQWKLIAIHHAGGMKLRKLHGKAGTYPANEGLWIQSIIEALNEAFGGSP